VEANWDMPGKRLTRKKPGSQLSQSSVLSFLHPKIEVDGHGSDISDDATSEDERIVAPSSKRKRRLDSQRSLGSFSGKRVKFALNSECWQVSSEGPPWFIKYAPRSTEEVAIHAKKVNEVRQALTAMTTRGLSRPRLLIISGPTGSSKTEIVKAIANELSLTNILEWNNHDRIEDGTNLPESFGDFLAGAEFYRSQNGAVPLIIIEDLPNVGHYDTKQQFNMSLLQWVCQPTNKLLPPTVLIVTEYDMPNDGHEYNDSVVVERIISRRVLSHRLVTRIKVPAVNMTLITKTIRGIVQQEAQLFSKIPKHEVDMSIKSVGSFGDIRAAITAMEFWARWRSKNPKILPIGKDTHLNLFHAIGRIIYGSHKDKHGRPVEDDSSVVESVVNDWHTSNRDGSFSLGLFENYICAHNSRLGVFSLCRCSELFSMCDLLVSYGIPGTMSEICFRGARQVLADAQLTPEKGVFRPLVYPREAKVARRRLQIAMEYDSFGTRYSQQYGTMVSKLDGVLLDGYYGSLCGTGPRIGGRIGLDTVTAETTEENEVDFAVSLPEPKADDAGFVFSDDDIEFSD
jgi:cell cycle checkpoint protein